MTIGDYRLHGDFNPDYPVTSGNQFPVSTPADTQWPAAARNAAGNAVVVWQAQVNEGSFSYRRVFGLRIGADGQPVGSQFRIDDGSEDYFPKPVVAIAPNGSFAVAWENYIRFFNASGTPVTGNVAFAPKAQYPGELSLASSGTGEFVVLWTSFSNGDPDGGIFARRYSTTGSPSGSEIHVNQTTADYQDGADVAYLPSGNWVAVWTFERESGQQQRREGQGLQWRHGINRRVHREHGLGWLAERAGDCGLARRLRLRRYPGSRKSDGSHTTQGRRLDSSSQPIGAEFLAGSSGGTDVFSNPDVAYGSQGRFLVVFVATDAEGSGILGQQFAADGAKVGPEIVLNTVQGSTQNSPAVASNHGDKFIVVWRNNKVGNWAWWDIQGIEYTLQDFQEPEITVIDSVGDPADLAIDFGTYGRGCPGHVAA